MARACKEKLCLLPLNSPELGLFDMIIAKIAGGLGNQMFQYAFGRTLSLHNNVELKLDVTMFETYEFHLYTMNHLNIVESYATAEEIGWFHRKRQRRGYVGHLLNPLFADPQRYVEEPRYTFVPEMLELKDPCYVDGYWQSEKYFLTIKDVLREEFSLREPLGDYSQNIAGQILSTKHPVSLHVRRGDHANHPTYKVTHGSRPVAYYDAAIKIMNDKVSKPHYFVFSDDVEWARKNIKTGFPTEFVGQGPIKNYEDLELMRLCSHHIISNSTFGWWGAWLSEFEHDGLTIAPTHWAKKFESVDLVPERWTKLPF